MAITVSEIRALSGAPKSLIDDSTIQTLIDFVKLKTQEYYQIRTTPTMNIESIHINDVYNVQVTKIPLLSLKKFKIGDRELDLSDLYFNGLGAIRKEKSNFYSYGAGLTQKTAKIKYVYGFVDEDENTLNFTTSALSSGNNVNITVEDGTLFLANDWIKIQDFDTTEIVKVKSVSSNTLTVDLDFSFDEDAKVVKLIEPKIIEEFNKYEVCVAVALRAVGSTYTFNTSWSNGNTSISKGVPYTHWAQSFDKNVEMRNELRGVIEAKLMSSG